MQEIRLAREDDWPAIWPVFRQVVAAGDTYPYPPTTDFETGFHIWMAKPERTYLVELDGQVVGTYYLKPNQPGLGGHVCNCGYMVAEEARGQGIATAMCIHSQQVALELGYRAMQFNLVVASNTRAVRLWRHLGFKIVGTLPEAFRASDGRFHNAYVMYKVLADEPSAG